MDAYHEPGVDGCARRGVAHCISHGPAGTAARKTPVVPNPAPSQSSSRLNTIRSGAAHLRYPAVQRGDASQPVAVVPLQQVGHVGPVGAQGHQHLGGAVEEGTDIREGTPGRGRHPACAWRRRW